MGRSGTNYHIGNVGPGANIQQGEYLYNITVNLRDASDAEAFLDKLRKKVGSSIYKGPLLRRLEPLVLVNRSSYLQKISCFLEEKNANVLYIWGLGGIGKSTLVRGALEFRRTNTSTIWVTCEGLDDTELVAQIEAGLGFGRDTVEGYDRMSPLQKLIAAIDTIDMPTILILDGFESLLDANNRYKSQRIADVIDSLTNSEHKAKVLVTTRKLPYGIGKGSSGSELLHLGGLNKEDAKELFRMRAGAVFRVETTINNALSKLEGHPKFIEMFVSAFAELPLDSLISDLLTATDIGDFVTNQLLNLLSISERQVLQAAIVFSEPFSFNVLDSIYRDLYKEPISVASVRSLTRRAIFESVTEPKVTYYLHSLLRDALSRDVEQEATTHLAAAKWFLQNGDPTTIPESSRSGSLYHLRRAAQGGPDKLPENMENLLFSLANTNAAESIALALGENFVKFKNPKKVQDVLFKLADREMPISFMVALTALGYVPSSMPENVRDELVLKLADTQDLTNWLFENFDKLNKVTRNNLLLKLAEKFLTAELIGCIDDYIDKIPENVQHQLMLKLVKKVKIAGEKTRGVPSWSNLRNKLIDKVQS